MAKVQGELGEFGLVGICQLLPDGPKGKGRQCAAVGFAFAKTPKNI